ncbi:DUF1642 domain-containing protein [Pediococcus acidilactici]|uniref:DUF1642 domain-containing protein n=1 Tax=Pediococcus acidilactici TaxID=1254 RepID=UPI00132FC5F6|nr:DUF1642 domain-containing protein [Pediococcus acidilactici]KAF0500087.1 DUF1642 domain-containing protein [Pediococcus acidilactici]
MDIEEVKEELTKRMAEAHSDYIEDPVGGEYADGYASGCEYAIKLLENLQEKKVVIPKFVADWIEEAKEHYGSEIDPLKIIYWTGDYINDTDSHYEWLENIYNQKLLLNTVINGYEVKKESKYRIKLPGLAGRNGQQYISKSADGKLFSCARRDYLQQEFTNNELKQLPDWVRRLELEEVED